MMSEQDPRELEPEACVSARDNEDLNVVNLLFRLNCCLRCTLFARLGQFSLVRGADGMKKN